MSRQRLARSLAPTVATMLAARGRNLGAGAAFPAATDVDGGIVAGDRFVRTELLWECIYDGARWLTLHEYHLVLSELVTLGTASPQATAPRNLRYDYAPAVAVLALHSKVSTPNDASNYWSITVQALSLGLSTSDTIYTFSTAGDGTGSTRRITPPTLALPTNRDWFRIYVSKTGSPGSLDVAGSLDYRLVVG